MIIQPDVLNIRPTDKAFDKSPDAGDPDCVCSRCGNQIQEGEFPIRFFTTNNAGEVDESSMEYRLCEYCTTGEKYFRCEGYEETEYKCRKQCNDCKK